MIYRHIYLKNIDTNIVNLIIPNQCKKIDKQEKLGSEIVKAQRLHAITEQKQPDKRASQQDTWIRAKERGDECDIAHRLYSTRSSTSWDQPDAFQTGRSDAEADDGDDDDGGWCCCDDGGDDRRFVVDGTASRSCDESGWARRKKPEAASTPSLLVAGSASHATQAKQKMSGSLGDGSVVFTLQSVPRKRKRTTTWSFRPLP